MNQHQNFQKGEIVAICDEFDTPIYFSKIDHVTKTYFVAGDIRFYHRSGLKTSQQNTMSSILITYYQQHTLIREKVRLDNVASYAKPVLSVIDEIPIKNHDTVELLDVSCHKNSIKGFLDNISMQLEDYPEDAYIKEVNCLDDEIRLDICYSKPATPFELTDVFYIIPMEQQRKKLDEQTSLQERLDEIEAEREMILDKLG